MAVDEQVHGELATFAEGCFWGVEVTFRGIEGVLDARVGYTGGHTEQPTYKEVCSGRTGHAEAIEVRFDPERISYNDLLAVFWDSHNPTTLNQQGPDRGSQYRSAIFTHDAAQRAAAEQSRAELTRSGRFPRPIVTEIVDASTFWPAEDYHQRYLEQRGQVSCHLYS